jgi:hypothetical protein
MARTKTLLVGTPPCQVEKSLRRLGGNLRTARLRRNLTLTDVAQRIGTGTRAITDAEKGCPGTAVAVYVALLWVYDLMEPLAALADPARDLVGLGNRAA